MRVFVTGATGSIGGRLTEALVARGDEVVGLVRDARGAAHLRARGATPHFGDVARPETWREEAERADALVRASAVPFAKRSGAAWLRAATETTRIETEALISAARTGRARALLYTSGWFVAGDHGEAWIDESTRSTPLALGSYHLSGEALVRQAAEEGVPAFAIRPGTVYAADGNFANVILAEAARGRFKWFGEGRNFMPFVAVEDLVDAYVRALERPPVGEALYVVDDEPVRMREFVTMLAKEFGQKPGGLPVWVAAAIVGRPLPEMFAASYRVRNDRARRLLGWKPRHPRLRERIADVVAEYRKRQAVAAP